jgi:hypothetical protein
MNLSPGILGVSAAVLIAGVAGGAMFGAVPPMQQRGIHELLPEARTVAIAYRPQGELPDHYPLITRAGRYEVEELGERGLYSQRRYNYRAVYADYYPQDVYVDDGRSYEAELADAELAVARGVSAAPDAGSQQATAADAENAPLEPVGPAVAEVSARYIDVAAELASRN